MIKEKIACLIDLKSILTLVLVGALVAGWFLKMVTAEQFIPLVTMVLTFYFAKAATKAGGEQDDETRINKSTNKRG